MCCSCCLDWGPHCQLILNLSGCLAAGRGKQEFHPDWRHAGDVWKSGPCIHVLDRTSSCAIGCRMLSDECSQSALLLRGFGRAEDSLADFTGLPEGFVTGCSTHETSQLGDLVLRQSIRLLLPEQWWVPSSSPVKVLKDITPEKHCYGGWAALWWAEEVQLWWFLLFFSPVSLADQSWQQLCSRWCPTGSSGLPRGWQMPHCWNWNGCMGDGRCFLKVTFAPLGGSAFWALTTILKTTLTRLIPERLTTELLCASFRIFCWGTNNLFPLPVHLLHDTSIWPPRTRSFGSSVGGMGLWTHFLLDPLRACSSIW